MTKPPDNSRRPARPTRRFSAIKPPSRARATDDAPSAEAGPDTERAPVREPALAVADVEAVVPDAVAAEPVTATSAPSKGDARPKASAAGGTAAPRTAAGSGDEARIAKVMSRAGVCSRREAEGWILAGRVAVNGTTIASPALNIGPDDLITVDGYPIDKPEHTRLFMFHKTRGLVTTARDPEGRPTIYDALPEDLPRLITIGRLDINTEGLLLLTNDGGLARLLELPTTGWLRRYRVRANGRVDQSQLDELSKGITVDGVDYAGIDARLDRIQGANVWLTLGLREGKNREVKRVLEHLGLTVSRLIRISFGPFQLGDLAENAIEEVRTRTLRDQLGTALALKAGVDLVRDDDEPRAPARAETASTRTKPSRGPRAPGQSVPPQGWTRGEAEDGPRRKTQRSATADRKGRPVAVERISTAVRPQREESGRDRPARSGAGGQGRPGSARTEATGRTTRGRDPAAREGGTGGRDERGSRPRTVRQADAGFRRSDAAPGTSRPAKEEGRRPSRAPRPQAEGAVRPERGNERSGPPRARSSERPREGAVRTPARSGQREGGPSRFAGAEGRREDRGGGPRPGGKPGFKGGGRPGGGGKAPAGGGRGRPRG